MAFFYLVDSDWALLLRALRVHHQVEALLAGALRFLCLEDVQLRPVRRLDGQHHTAALVALLPAHAFEVVGGHVRVLSVAWILLKTELLRLDPGDKLVELCFFLFQVLVLALGLQVLSFESRLQMVDCGAFAP